MSYPVSAVRGKNQNSGGPTLLSSLMAFYKLSDLVDASGRSHTLTNNASATFAAGKIGNAVSLAAASSQYLSVADHADLSVAAGEFITFSFWVNFTTLGANRTILSKGDAFGGGGEYTIIYNSGTGRVEFVVRNAANTTTVTATASTLGAPSTGTWYFGVAWYDGVNLSIQFNNGTINTTAHSTGIFDAANDFTIGKRATNYMNGLVDAVGVWKRVLTVAERAALYNAGAGLEHPF